MKVDATLNIEHAERKERERHESEGELRIARKWTEKECIILNNGQQTETLMTMKLANPRRKYKLDRMENIWRNFR